MLKKVLNKKIEAFKEAFPEHQISKNGSIYSRENVQKIERKVKTTGFTVTKNTLNKIGHTREWTENKASNVYLITSKGKLMFRNNSNRFSNFSFKKARNSYKPELLNIYLIGRKYEWIKDYPNLLDYKFFQSFSSLAEARKFLGFEFISDKDFYNLFSNPDYRLPILSILIHAEDKSNAYKLLRNIDRDSKHLLIDYLTICEEKGFKMEIPAGKNKLKELHDNAIWEARKEDAENYSKLVVYEGKDCKFEKEWKNRGVSFKRINSPYEMFLTGVRQKHCIGTNYYNTLNNYSFYTIYWKDMEYQIQISQSGSVGQFYGFDNSHPSEELRDLVHSNIDFSHQIVKIRDYDYNEYPKVETNKKEVDEIIDEIPW